MSPEGLGRSIFGRNLYLKPGKELDALIAEKVMGWEEYQSRKEWCKPNQGDYIMEFCEWQPSTLIGPAWEAVEKLNLFKDYHLITFDGVYTILDKDRMIISSSTRAPHAICLAALKAVGVEV